MSKEAERASIVYPAQVVDCSTAQCPKEGARRNSIPVCDRAAGSGSWESQAVPPQRGARQARGTEAASPQQIQGISKCPHFLHQGHVL